MQEGSTTCDDIQLAEVACCPSKAEIPCNFCTDGLTADSSAVVPGADGFTCGDLVSFSVSSDISDTCAQVKLAEFICCPSVDSKDEGVSSKSQTTRPTDALQEIAPVETELPTSRPTDALEVPTNASDPPTQVIDASRGLLIKSSFVYMLFVTTTSLILW